MILNLERGRVKRLFSFYDATDFIAEGTFSEVYRAYDLRNDTDVAIKLYKHKTPEALAQSKRERNLLERLSGLSSPFFPKVFLSVTHQGHPALVMELIEVDKGRILSLRDILPTYASSSEDYSAPLPEFWAPENLVKFFHSLTESLCLLDETEIIHRDIKPANILVRKKAGGSDGTLSLTPCILDFNTGHSTDSQGGLTGGTPQYLPPEVTSGARKQPDASDDLWAVTRVLWEVLHGLGAPVSEQLKCHPCIPELGSLPTLRGELKNGLQLQRSERHASARVLRDAISSVWAPESAADSLDSAEKIPLVSDDEILWARTRREEIVSDIGALSVGPGELYASKEVCEKVGFIFSTLSSNETQALDIANDLVSLGPRAIPVVLEHMYKFESNSSIYSQVLRALIELARVDPDRAKQAIEIYCTSSDYTIRQMCLDLIAELKYFPTCLVEELADDRSLFLTQERIRISDLCIRMCKDGGAVFALNKYICCELLFDDRAYTRLRNNVANRLHELDFETLPELIVEDAFDCIWETTSEWNDIDEPQRLRASKSLVQLLGDGFSQNGSRALDLIRKKKVQVATKRGEPLLRVFAHKLALQFEPAWQYLESSLMSLPSEPVMSNRDAALAHAAFDTQRKRPKPISERQKNIWDTVGRRISRTLDVNAVRQGTAHDLVRRYLGIGPTSTQLFNELRFRPDSIGELDRLLGTSLSQTEIEYALQLLKGCESRYPVPIISLICRHWRILGDVNYDLMLEAIGSHRLMGDLRESVKKKLVTDMNDNRLQGRAAKAVDRILRQP